MRKTTVHFETIQPDQSNIDNLVTYLNEASSGVALQSGEVTYTPCWLLPGDSVTADMLSFEGIQQQAPRRPTVAGALATWVQLEGSTVLRGGNSNQRRKNIVNAQPGDVIGIVGNGKRSFENADPLVPSRGLFVEVIPHT